MVEEDVPTGTSTEEVINPTQWGDDVVCRRIAWAANERLPDRLWSHGGRLVELDPRKGSFRVHSRQTLKGLLNRAVRLVSEASRGGSTSRNTIAMSSRYMDPLLTTPSEYGFRELRGIRHCPYLSPSGRLVTAPGYDEETGEWLVWEGEPVAPEAMDAESAGRWIATLLHDFPFVSHADRQHALGLMLLAMMRPMIMGPTPLHLVTSTGGGAGKSYLADIFGLLLRGEYAQPIELSDWSSEAQRQLSGWMATAPDVTFLDNLTTGGSIGGAQLHRLLTARGEVAVRPVGGQTVSVPVRCVWMGTVNGPAIDPEQTRRTVLIQLERRTKGRSFLIEDLHSWVLAHRTEILSALGWVIQQWLDAGRPTHSRRPLPSFVEWSHTVGGCVAHLMGLLGQEDHWLSEEHRPQPARPEWEELADLWPRQEGAAVPVWSSSGLILELLSQYDLIHFCEATESNTHRGRQTRLGRLLLHAARVGVEGAENVEVLTRMGPRRREYLVRRRDAEPSPPLPAPAPIIAPDPQVEELNDAWRAELAAMAERGVLVSAEAWAEAETSYRQHFIANEPDEEVALERQRSLDAYTGEVLHQARRGDGRVRSLWRPDGAWTTRITAHSPPLQAVTKEGGFRGAIVALPHHRLIVADWDHSHLRIAGGRSRDPRLIDDLAIGHDPHQQVGDYLTEATISNPDLRRRIGKTVNFAALNLCSAKKLCEILAGHGVSLCLEEARAHLRRWSERYERLSAWQRRWGGVPNWQTPLLQRPISVPVDVRGVYPARVLAGILQSIEADAMRFVMARSRPELTERYGARLVMVVHDEAIWEVHEDAAPGAARAAHRLMLQALSLVCGDAPPSATVSVRAAWSSSSAQG